MRQISNSTSTSIRMLCVFLAAFAVGTSCGFSLTEAARKLGGDVSTINTELLNKISLNVPTTDFPREVINQPFEFIFQGNIQIEVFVGGKTRLNGTCDGFGLSDPGGDVTVTGELQNGTFLIQGEQLQRYDITLSAVGFSFSCVIPLAVVILEVFWIGPIDITGLQDTNDVGQMFLSSNQIGFSQTISIYSRDFAKEPPVFQTVGDCTPDIAGLNVAVSNTAALFDNFPPPLDLLTINLDGEVENALRADSSLITDPVNEEICAIFTDLAATVGDFLVTNPLTEGELFDFQDDPFSPEAGQIDALEFEQNLNTGGTKLFDFTKANFLVDIFFPKDGAEENQLVSGLFETFPIVLNNETIDQSDALGILIGVLNQEVGTNIVRNPVSGLVEDADLLAVINLINNLDPALPDVPLDQPFNVNFEAVTEFGTFGLDLNITGLQLSEVKRGESDASLLSQLKVIGAQTILLPEISLGDLGLDAQMSVELSAVGEASEFLPEFNVTLRETFEVVDAVWNEFRAGLGALFAIVEAFLFGLMLGPLLEQPLDCFLSTLFTSPVITGVSLSTTGIEAAVTGFTDFILFLIGDVLNVAIFAYQSLAARALETLLGDVIVNFTFIPPGVCPPLAVEENDTAIYDFSQGIFKSITDVVDASFYEGLVDFALDREGTSTLFPVLSEAIVFSFELFPIQGWLQTVDFRLNRLDVKGLIPPTVNEGSLSVPNTSLNFPRGIVAELEAGSVINPIGFILDVDIDLSEPFVAPNVTQFSATPPSILVAANNSFVLDIEFASIEAAAEVFAKLTRYNVESITLEDVFKLDCWVSRLDQPGGWDRIDVLLDQIAVTMDCDCDTPVFNELETAIENSAAWPDLLNTLQSFANALITLLTSDFDDDNWNFTVTNAERVCEGLPPLPAEPVDIPGLVEDAFSAYLLVGFLGASLSVTLPFAAMHRYRRGQEKKEPVLGSGEIDMSVTAQAVAPARNVPERRIPLKGRKAKAAAAQTGETVLQYRKAMYKNPMIPLYARILIPIMLFLNIGLFVYGDLGVAIKNSLEGVLLGAPLDLRDFGDFSVITSTIALYENGAIGLAIMITILAIVWPYAKLLALLFCWFSPPVINCCCFKQVTFFKFRGRVLHFLDALGKWSLIEIYFIIFLRLVFEISVATPKVAFFPNSDLYQFALVIAPQPSLYTFTSAVIMSIIAGNICLFYHEKIIHLKEAYIRDTKLLPKGITNDTNSTNMAEYEWRLNATRGDPSKAYILTLTQRTQRLLAFLAVVAVGVLMVAAGTFAVKVKYLGLAGVLLELEGQGSEFEYSIFYIAELTFGKAVVDNDPGAVFFGFVFIVTLILTPMMLNATLIYMLYGKFTLLEAKTLLVWKSIIQAWCAVEVFVLALGISKIEVGQIASYLVADQCAFLTDFMRDTLLPLGFVDEADVAATCFAIEVELEGGTFVLVGYVLFQALTSYSIRSMFSAMVHQRGLDVEKRTARPRGVLERTPGVRRMEQARTYPRAFHRLLATVGLAEVYPDMDARV